MVGTDPISYIMWKFQFTIVVQCNAHTYHIEYHYQHFSRCFTFSKPVNMFSNNKTTHLHFLHVEVPGILLLTKRIRSTHGESHEYYITSWCILDKLSIWIKEVWICENALNIIISPTLVYLQLLNRMNWLLHCLAIIGMQDHAVPNTLTYCQEG